MLEIGKIVLRTAVVATVSTIVSHYVKKALLKAEADAKAKAQ